MLPFPRTEIDSSGKVLFFPPVSEQRYGAVYNILNDDRWKGKLKTLIDFGCGRLGFFKVLRTMDCLDLILCIDIDENKLRLHGEKADPSFEGFVKPREKPFRVKVYQGSIGETDSCILNSDAVICIEVIEHLFPNELNNLPFTIFGYAKPQIAIITTPNVEFNVVFPDNTKKRHADHKFEWRRVQFRDWAENIIQRYPDYTVEFHDICPPPKGYELIGPLTQMAVFYKKLNTTYNLQIQSNIRTYDLIYDYKYPVICDSNRLDETILDEIKYYMTKYCHKNKNIISVEAIHDNVKTIVPALRDLENILVDIGYIINDRHELLLLQPRIKYLS